MSTRQLKIKGNKTSPLVIADILINGKLVFSGEIAPEIVPVNYSSQPAQSADLVTVDYEGTTEQETIAVEIHVTEGTVLIGPMFADVTNLNTNELLWTNMSNEDINAGDGRTGIKVNNVAPTWPEDPSMVSPGGTPDHPAWTGYCFFVPSGSNFSCNFDAPAQIIPIDDTEPV